jgi:selenoprotein W-related protein
LTVPKPRAKRAYDGSKADQLAYAAEKDAMTEQKPKLSITYCTQCNWLLRSAWMASEVLSTFSLEMGSVTLVPGSGGIFEIRIDGDLVWERKRDGGFPDVKQLKQLVRDRIDPDRDLGHIDRHSSSGPT